MRHHQRSSHTGQEWEAQKIYEALFHQSPSDSMSQRFIEASEHLHSKATPKEVEQYYRAIQSVADLEALEVASRYRHKMPLLRSKFHLMVYLAETAPENQHFFVNTERRAVRGWLALFNGALRTLFKLGKGLYLLRKVQDE